MGLGITGTIQLAATLVFAIPVAVFGLDQVAAGNTALGGVMVVVAALMVALPHYLTTPGDVPAAVAERVIGKAVKVPDEDDDRT